MKVGKVKFSNPRKLARPAGFEPATHGLEGRRPFPFKSKLYHTFLFPQNRIRAPLEGAKYTAERQRGKSIFSLFICPPSQKPKKRTTDSRCTSVHLCGVAV